MLQHISISEQPTTNNRKATNNNTATNTSTTTTVLVSVVRLDFHGRFRVVRTMFIPGALHGVEASLLASSSLRELRSSISGVVWSCRQPLASVGAVLSLLDGLQVCDPAYCIVRFRFRLIRRYLVHWPFEVGWVYRFLDVVSEGCPGHGPIHLLASNAVDVGFRWDSRVLGWDRPGVLALSNLAVLFSTFGLLCSVLGRIRLQLICVVGEYFVVGRFLMCLVHCSSSTLAMFGRGMRRCSGVCWWCLEWFPFWQGPGVSQFHAGSVVVLMVMVTFLVSAPFPSC